MGALILLVVGFMLGLVFVQASKTGSVKPAIVLAVVGLGLGLLLASIRVVPAGHVGVVDFFGRVSSRPLNPGINLVNPLAKVVMMSVRTVEDKEVMAVPSKEGLTIKLDISVLLKLDPRKAVDMYKTVGPNYLDVVLTPQFRAAARGVTVAHEAKALYTSAREELAQKIHDALSEMVADRGVIVERVLLRAIALPPMVATAIENKLKAEQDAERMKFVVKREKQEAERKRVEAQGIRDAQSIIDESLSQRYLQYLWTTTLNQNPNVIYVATEANLPMFRTLGTPRGADPAAPRRVRSETF